MIFGNFDINPSISNIVVDYNLVNHVLLFSGLKYGNFNFDPSILSFSVFIILVN